MVEKGSEDGPAELFPLLDLSELHGYLPASVLHGAVTGLPEVLTVPALRALKEDSEKVAQGEKVDTQVWVISRAWRPSSEVIGGGAWGNDLCLPNPSPIIQTEIPGRELATHNI